MWKIKFLWKKLVNKNTVQRVWIKKQFLWQQWNIEKNYCNCRLDLISRAVWKLLHSNWPITGQDIYTLITSWHTDPAGMPKMDICLIHLINISYNIRGFNNMIGVWVGGRGVMGVGHTEKKRTFPCSSFFCVPLTDSVFSDLYRPLIKMLHIYV